MADSEKPDSEWPLILDQKCVLCDTNRVLYKCVNCDEMICDSCKKTHLKSKAAKDHKVVCLKSAEIYENDQIGKKCPNHSAEDLLMFCNTCNCPICRECVTSGVHLHHPMIKVEEVMDIKQNQLSNIIKQSNEKTKSYKDVIKTITKNKMEFSMLITKKIEEVKDRNNQLKCRLDVIASEYIKQLQNKDKEYKKALTELEKKLESEISELNNLIQQCENKITDRNKEMVQFIADITQRLDKYKSCYPPDLANPPNFFMRYVDDQMLKDLFGHLDIKKTLKVYPPFPRNSNTLPPATPAIDVKVVGSFPSKQRRVVTKGEDQAWLWSCGITCTGISLVTSSGKIVQDIQTDFDMFDAAISKSGDLLVTTVWGNKVRKLTKNNTFKDIFTALDGYNTQGITVTDTGNVLVSLYKYKDSHFKIVEITTSGQQIRAIHQQETTDNKVLFNNPMFICTNVNGDIIVEDSGKVVVVNQHGQKRFIYEGRGRQLQKSFSPQYIVTDKHGHIFISDSHNAAVHMLDRDGKFIQYLVTREQGCEKPEGMDIDSSGRLWLCNEGNNKILIVKYV